MPIVMNPSVCGKKCKVDPPISLSHQGIDFDLSGEFTFRGGKYALKIRSTRFGNPPFFRFDSAGPTHVNEEDGRGLVARVVPTPHFHKVWPDGIMRAYRTSLLSEEESARLITEDVTQGGIHFFNESNLVATAAEFRVQVLRDDLPIQQMDPLNGVTFN